jgi:hypothetical protein
MRQIDLVDDWQDLQREALGYMEYRQRLSLYSL